MLVSGADFARWADAGDADRAEAIRVLRRAVFISLGRRYDFERMRRARELATVVGGACHGFAPERVDAALRNPGTCRDFGADPSGIFPAGWSEAFLAFEREAEA